MLLRLHLVSPWLLKNGIKSTSFFAVREEFVNKVQSLAAQQKPLAYAALAILRFLIDCRKSIIERGFETFRRSFFGSLNSTVPRTPALKEADSNSLPSRTNS
jgi:hypothetical protein